MARGRGDMLNASFSAPHPSAVRRRPLDRRQWMGVSTDAAKAAW